MATGQITVHDTDREAGIVVDDDNAAYSFDPGCGEFSLGDTVTFDIEGGRATNVKAV